ncbi:MAG: hypothetical protein J6B40_00500 [Oscillospiraceae bacterium]|nr:hypothetical protein [Oscillospiraceae bacterium]
MYWYSPVSIFPPPLLQKSTNQWVGSDFRSILTHLDTLFTTYTPIITAVPLFCKKNSLESLANFLQNIGHPIGKKAQQKTAASPLWFEGKNGCFMPFFSVFATNIFSFLTSSSLRRQKRIKLEEFPDIYS